MPARPDNADMSDTSRMRDVPSLVAVTAGSTTRGDVRQIPQGSAARSPWHRYSRTGLV